MFIANERRQTGLLYMLAMVYGPLVPLLPHNVVLTLPTCYLAWARPIPNIDGN
jgi:hypothetical protein